MFFVNTNEMAWKYEDYLTETSLKDVKLFYSTND